MDEIIKQSFTFAEINLCKNYSSLNDKKIVKTSQNLHYIRPKEKYLIIDRQHRKFYYDYYVNNRLLNVCLYSIKNTRFFHNNDAIGKYVTLSCIGSFQTIKDKQIKRHYNNPFASIKIVQIERWIKKNNHKVTIKLFLKTKERKVNKKYFTKQIESITITLDLLRGNFLITKFKKAHKTSQKSFYCNSFISFERAINEIFNLNHRINEIFNLNHRISEESPLFDILKKTINDYDFQIGIGKILDIPSTFWENTIQKPTSVFLSLWIKKFAELKKIKIPNGYSRFLYYYYPTEKFLKRNDRKLVAAVLDRIGIKSNITIKLLHQYPDINLTLLFKTCILFGDNFSKYIGNISAIFFNKNDKKLFGISKDCDIYARNTLPSFGNDFYTPPKPSISNIEKENITKIINDYSINSESYQLNYSLTSSDLINSIYDHINMIEKVKEYYPNITITARSINAFVVDHRDLSKIEQQIKRGYIIEHIFNEMFVQEIEKPIVVQFETSYNTDYENKPHSYQKVFYPKILKTSNDYMEEGMYMHHCVNSYIDITHSMIISLRTDEERVTCEFDKKTRICIQSRYFQNQSPPEYYENALIQLEKKIQTCQFPLLSETRRIQQIINGKKVPQEEIF